MDPGESSKPADDDDEFDISSGEEEDEDWDLLGPEEPLTDLDSDSQTPSLTASSDFNEVAAPPEEPGVEATPVKSEVVLWFPKLGLGGSKQEETKPSEDTTSGEIDTAVGSQVTEDPEGPASPEWSEGYFQVNADIQTDGDSDSEHGEMVGKEELFSRTKPSANVDSDADTTDSEVDAGDPGPRTPSTPGDSEGFPSPTFPPLIASQSIPQMASPRSETTSAAPSRVSSPLPNIAATLGDGIDNHHQSPVVETGLTESHTSGEQQKASSFAAAVASLLTLSETLGKSITVEPAGATQAVEAAKDIGDHSILRTPPLPNTPVELTSPVQVEPTSAEQTLNDMTQVVARLADGSRGGDPTQASLANDTSKYHATVSERDEEDEFGAKINRPPRDEAAETSLTGKDLLEVFPVPMRHGFEEHLESADQTVTPSETKQPTAPARSRAQQTQWVAYPPPYGNKRGITSKVGGDSSLNAATTTQPDEAKATEPSRFDMGTADVRESSTYSQFKLPGRQPPDTQEQSAPQRPRPDVNRVNDSPSVVALAALDNEFHRALKRSIDEARSHLRNFGWRMSDPNYPTETRKLHGEWDLYRASNALERSIGIVNLWEGTRRSVSDAFQTEKDTAPRVASGLQRQDAFYHKNPRPDHSMATPSTGLQHGLPQAAGRYEYGTHTVHSDNRSFPEVHALSPASQKEVDWARAGDGYFGRPDLHRTGTVERDTTFDDCTFAPGTNNASRQDIHPSGQPVSPEELWGDFELNGFGPYLDTGLSSDREKGRLHGTRRKLKTRTGDSTRTTKKNTGSKRHSKNRAETKYARRSFDPQHSVVFNQLYPQSATLDGIVVFPSHNRGPDAKPRVGFGEGNVPHSMRTHGYNFDVVEYTARPSVGQPSYLYRSGPVETRFV